MTNYYHFVCVYFVGCTSILLQIKDITHLNAWRSVCFVFIDVSSAFSDQKEVDGFFYDENWITDEAKEDFVWFVRCNNYRAIDNYI